MHVGAIIIKFSDGRYLIIQPQASGVAIIRYTLELSILELGKLVKTSQDLNCIS